MIALAPQGARSLSRRDQVPPTADGLPRAELLLAARRLAALTRNTVRLGRAYPMQLLATPTPLQQRALDLLGVQPAL